MLPLFALTSSISPGSRNLFVRTQWWHDAVELNTSSSPLSPCNWLTEVAAFSSPPVSA
jgi:hypothetical protein